MRAESQLDYYQRHNFNPVPIDVEIPKGWESQLAKRRNLYERHLGIPLSLLKGRDVLEFGCNSGENALVLATMGADLTLVEPNDQVLDRLDDLFTKFNLKPRISELIQTDFESFLSDRTYDLVIAEGFLFNLPNRDQGLKKICDLLPPGGLGVISFIDRHATLVHATRQLILWKACYLSGVEDVQSEDCLNLAHTLYDDDFASIAASRPFDAWWKDALISPWTNNHLWTYQEIIPIIEESGCEFYGSSPKWAKVDSFDWYKNLHTSSERHHSLLESWGSAFPYFMTGMPPSGQQNPLPSLEVLQSVVDFVGDISNYTSPEVSAAEVPEYPAPLHQYFNQCEDTSVNKFNSDMKMLYDAARGDSLDNLLATYRSCKVFRSTWGAHYHYVCFVKSN